MLAVRGTALDRVLELTVDDEVVVGRLLKRAQVEGRGDDTEEVIRERMAIYHRETKPLSDTYRERGPARRRSTASARSTRSPQRILTALT